MNEQLTIQEAHELYVERGTTLIIDGDSRTFLMSDDEHCEKHAEFLIDWGF